jgi:phosphopantetheine--protein transferase-like protein
LNRIIEALERRGIACSIADISSLRPFAEGNGGAFARFLSPEEISCLRGMKIAKRRLDFISGRIAGKRAVRRFIQMKRLPGAGASGPGFREIDIRRTGTGAPRVFLNNVPGHMGISISHSPAFAASAVCADNAYAGIGIDIERIEPRHDSFFEVAFRSSEIRGIKSLSGQDLNMLHELATRYWSLKEAALKSMGIGLNVDLKDIEISEMGPGAVSVACENEAGRRLKELGGRAIRAESHVMGDHVLSVALLMSDPSPASHFFMPPNPPEGG